MKFIKNVFGAVFTFFAVITVATAVVSLAVYVITSIIGVDATVPNQWSQVFLQPSGTLALVGGAIVLMRKFIFHTDAIQADKR